MRQTITKREKQRVSKPAELPAHNRRHIVVTSNASRAMIDLFRGALDRGDPAIHNRAE